MIERALTPIMSWKKISFSTNSLHSKCNLCLEEKICILKYLNGHLLNTRKEIISVDIENIS